MALAATSPHESICVMRNLLKTQRRALGLGVVGALIGVGVAVGVAVASGSGGLPRVRTGGGSGGKPVAYARTVSSPPPIAAPLALHRVVASLKSGRVFTFLRNGRVVSARERSDLVSARISASVPAYWPVQGHPAVRALYVTERIPGLKNGASLKSMWEADLLTGAVVELAGKSGSLRNDVGYVSFSGQLPDGKVDRDMDGAMGDVARGQQFAGANDSDTAIEKSVTRVASRFGLSVDSVTIFRALGAAPAVVLTAPDVSTAEWRREQLETALFGSPPHYEGFYLEIRGENGKTYVRRSTSFLTSTGRLWTDASVQG